MSVTKEISIDFVGIRFLKLFKYIHLRNDGKINMFKNIMYRYRSIYDDNKLGIRISRSNLLYQSKNETVFPITVKRNMNYQEMCVIIRWSSIDVVKNIKNHHVLPASNTF